MTLWRFVLLWCAALFSVPSLAHDFRLGGLRIDHPYATPSEAGATAAAVYFRRFGNTGPTDDRLIGASTPVAERVVIHQSVPNAAGLALMYVEPAVELPAGASPAFRHTDPDGYHLMLQRLNRPLRVGDRFSLTLHFERAGSVDVVVWVQQPRRPAAHDHSSHSHSPRSSSTP